jgi:hypothetical protein
MDIKPFGGFWSGRGGKQAGDEEFVLWLRSRFGRQSLGRLEASNKKPAQGRVF